MVAELAELDVEALRMHADDDVAQALYRGDWMSADPGDGSAENGRSVN